ncbi:MAG: hypothetical protein QOH76_3073 [Thermoleophilaceae bacterium]|jgi:hypothetical protein|nr:hypothetical protein [Thermoleophilaceae bacterium]
MSFRLLTVPVVVCAVVVGGCGGSDKKSDSTSSGDTTSTSAAATPKPKETIGAYGDRLEAAITAIGKKQCAPVKALNADAGFAFFCNAQARKAYAGFKVTGTETFGSGGVVEYTDAEVKTAKQPAGVKSTPADARGLVVVAIVPTGKYSATGPVVPVVPTTSIGTKAASHADQDRRAQAFLDSVRTHDCAKFFKYAVTPGVRNAKEACAKILDKQYALLAKALKLHADARPVYEGGNDRVTVYGLRTGKDYRTLTVVKGAPGDPEPYLVMGTTRGPAG